MPDRELPRHLLDELASSLEKGAPLVAPLASQARYATARIVLPPARWRLRALTVAVAAAGIVVVALAGPPQPREWIAQSVNALERQVGVPANEVTPSPTHESEATSGEQTGQRSPESTEQAEPRQSPEPGESPEPLQQQSPEPQESPGGDGGGSSDGDQPQVSPSPSSDGH